MNATFSCITTADGTSQWTVNGVICMPTPYNKECQSRGIIATIDENLDSAMTVLTLKMDGLAINNGSQIQCYSAYVTVDISAPASLVIAGPPLTPNSALSVLNATVLQLSWEKPFTWTEVANITNYTVTMYNDSSQEWKNWTFDPSLNKLAIVGRDVALECVVLLFEVSASNAVGESQASSVNGGFPIAIKWADQNGTSRLTLSVHHNKDGSVLITVKVQPPIMCPYQMAKYDVIISDFTAGVQLAKTSITHTYGDGGTFDIGLTFVPVIKEERTYYVILSVNSFDFASLQAFASFSLVIGATTGASAAVLFAVLIVIIVTICCRFHRGKASNDEQVTEHHYQDAPVVSSRSFEHTTPLDPVYAHIDECRNLASTTENEIKEAEHISIEKCVPDYARHNPDGDYIEMKVVMESAEGSSCGDTHTPLAGGPFQETL
eukprot:Em0006g485a